MKYVGKLFGQIGRTRGYFDLGKTSEDWDALEARAERAEESLKEYFTRAEKAEAELHALRLVCGTTAADKFTTWVDRGRMSTPTPRTDSEEYPEGEGQSFRVVSADFARTLERELAIERARLDWLESSAATELQSERGWIDRAAIDAAMKEGAK